MTTNTDDLRIRKTNELISPEQLVAELDAANTAEAVALDINSDITGALQRINPKIVIHTSGPFQTQGYDVAKSCIGQGAHYIDLADDESSLIISITVCGTFL